MECGTRYLHARHPSTVLEPPGKSFKGKEREADREPGTQRMKSPQLAHEEAIVHFIDEETEAQRVKCPS